jgi:hypothetical protein
VVRRQQRDWYPLREVACLRRHVRGGHATGRNTAIVNGQKETHLRKLSLVLLLTLAGCARPPHLSTSLNVQKKSDDLILVTLKVVNLENSVTTPINIEVTGQARTAGHWNKPETLFHPAAFVLNRNEQREITKFWKIQADGVRTTIVIKEQENGHLLKSEKAEKVF